MKKNSKKKSLNPRKVLKGTKKNIKPVKGSKSVKGNKPVKGNKLVKGNKPFKGNKSDKKKKSKKKTINLELQPEVGGRNGRHFVRSLRQKGGPSKHSQRSKRTSRKMIKSQQERRAREVTRNQPVNRVEIMLKRIGSEVTTKLVQEIETQEREQNSRNSENPLAGLTLQPELLKDSATIDERQIIGRGNFGQVYKVNLTSATEEVECALKKLEDTNNIEQFRQELNMMHLISSGTDNPNIIKLLGYLIPESTQGQYGILLEYCSMGDLKNFISGKIEHTQQQFSLYDCITGIINGMEHIHSKGIMHCDLAARNVLLKKEKNERERDKYKYVCKIADFGLSSDEPDRGTLVVQIPIRWYSPECLRENKVSKALDVWSFGCILIEILNLEKYPFFNNESTFDMIRFYQELITMERGNKIHSIKEGNDFKQFGDMVDGEYTINHLFLMIIVDYIFVGEESRKTFTDLKIEFEKEPNSQLLQKYNIFGSQKVQIIEMPTEIVVEDIPEELDTYFRRATITETASLSNIYVAQPPPQTMLLYVDTNGEGLIVAREEAETEGGAPALPEGVTPVSNDGFSFYSFVKR